MTKKIIILLLGLVAFTACYRDSKEEIYQNFEPCVIDVNATISYSQDIAPILAANCAISGCHNSSSRQSNLDLSGYADSERIAADGRLGNRINGIGPIMPPSGSLLQCDIDKIEIWVNNGAPNN